MTISLEKIGKRYNRSWIFRNVDFTFRKGQSYALLGPNGSGKSTLLQIISTYLIPSEGKVNWLMNDQLLDADEVYQYFAVTAPYLELVEELTLEESLQFHRNLKPLLLDDHGIFDLLQFQPHRQKRVKQLSSGMKQRLKLALSILSDVPVLLLDEPGTNLDEQGIGWYRDLLRDFAKDRLIIIASNRLEEYDLCEEHIDVVQWK
jgi:ABC-type multidrug transport system ATPase subunit